MAHKQPHISDGGNREVMKTKISEGKVQTCKEAMLTMEVERRNHKALWPFKLLHLEQGFLWEEDYSISVRS